MPAASRPTRTAQALIDAADALRRACDALRFADPVTHVYNPLGYARAMHAAYLRRFARRPKRVVFLGMNPGPWGMAQTGVPFGEIAAVRDWLALDAPVGEPDQPHPKRLITGLRCPRAEVSGQRLWGLFAQRFGEPDAFFDEHFVTNYCPLVFMEASARNRTPDKLPAHERDPLTAACDELLRRVMLTLRPAWLIGVGRFATHQAERVAGQLAAEPGLKAPIPTVATILHPSPASPAANRGWTEHATRQLTDLGVWPADARSRSS